MTSQKVAWARIDINISSIKARYLLFEIGSVLLICVLKQSRGPGTIGKSIALLQLNTPTWGLCMIIRPEQ